jgi:sugar transferase (PEP-CTERM system associated)
VRIKLFGHYVHLSIFALAVAEQMICVAAPLLASWLRYGDNMTASDLIATLPQALVFAVVMLISMIAMGLYGFQQRARTLGIGVRLVAAAMLASLAVAVTDYALPQLAFGRGVLALTFALCCIGCFVIRVGFQRVAGDELLKRRVLVYGVGKRAQSIMQLRRRSDRRGFTVVGFVSPGDDAAPLVPPEKIIEDPDSLFDLLRVRGVSEVVVALDDQRRNFPAEALLNCRMRGIDVIDLVAFLERETGALRVDMVNPSWLIFSGGFRRSTVQDLVERAFDIVAASVLLLFAWPLMLLTCVAIKLEEGLRAPVFYVQPRVGYQGRVFGLTKFRSMRLDAESNGAVWAQKGDTRVTRVGAFIRKVRIDELPQIFNVLRGEMCFVGPRPERPEFVTRLSASIPYYRERHWVKPGLTGWAQLCYPYGASERDSKEKLQYDLYYVKHRSLVFDLVILLQTAEVVVLGKGAR